MSEKQSCRVLINPHPMYWIKDRGRIIIVDEQGQETYTLHAVEAAVWTWLTLAYSYPKIVELLATMLGLTWPETEQRLRVIFQTWKNAGILVLEAR